MPTPGKQWCHITFTTYGTWLPGDPRGFRDRGHRVHSSGDHRRPPPRGEHEGLRRFSQAITGPAVVLSGPEQGVVVEALRGAADRRVHRVAAVAVSSTHVHLLVELPVDLGVARREVGVLKKSASQRLRGSHPGRVWAVGCGVKYIRDRAHQVNTFRYIARHAQEGARVWTG